MGANEQDDQQALFCKAEGDGGKPRARAESIYESRGFGSPDYRSSRIEISTGRMNKRVINVTSVHSNDKVPLYLDGRYGRSATVVRDTYSPVPNLTSYPSAIGTQGQGYRVTSSLGSPYIGGYSYAYGTTSNSSLFAPARSSQVPQQWVGEPGYKTRSYLAQKFKEIHVYNRYRTPSPVRYSVQPRFRSRFYQ